ncbi:hypothetical protein [Candidatus Poriferisodalis sp.]|uniref:hypothetical protein n=1 Tax=Candidatus Poriferisodalis sp. TaxID=3101277 RepID=UPI003B5AB87F
MSPPERALARAVELLGEAGVRVRSAVVVTDAETARAHRRVMTVRVAGFAVGAALAISWGIGWLLIVAAVVAHQLLFNVLRLLAATDEGLVLADISFRRAVIVARWQTGTDATLVLRTDSPQVEVTVEPPVDNTGVGEPWIGQVSGSDLDGFETTIRAAGGEPLRRTATD